VISCWTDVDLICLLLLSIYLDSDEIQTEIVSTCIYKLVYSQSCPQAFLYTNHNAPYYIIYPQSKEVKTYINIHTIVSRIS
jgi:hypothetical protein